jgi:hypothetical protein
VHLGDVMQQVSDRLDTIVGLRCFAYPPGKVVPPAAVVSYPDKYTFDETYGRGMDRLTLPVVLVVGRPVDRSTRDQIAAYCDGAGASSVKQVLESGTYTAFDAVRVAGVEFDVVAIAAIDYLAATFDLDIAGKGSP